MDIKYGIIIIASVTATLSIFAIFAGCNAVHPEFDFNGNGADSIPKQCEEFQDPSQYKQCVNKATHKEFACANWFWWLRY